MQRLAIDEYYKKRIINYFEELIITEPKIIQEMIEQGDILDPELLRVCRIHGIRSKKIVE